MLYINSNKNKPTSAMCTNMDEPYKHKADHKNQLQMSR